MRRVVRKGTITLVLGQPGSALKNMLLAQFPVKSNITVEVRASVGQALRGPEYLRDTGVRDKFVSSGQVEKRTEKFTMGSTEKNLAAMEEAKAQYMYMNKNYLDMVMNVGKVRLPFQHGETTPFSE
ncbi:hypothetical protein V7S43_009071 [Phytophthora oleae]|uniref:Guanylate kinase-like domain-containing protein n=1 Tax=Phytophthora oleae TaxID=2107226 RepID=A0ABD3FJ95_9STRA